MSARARALVPLADTERTMPEGKGARVDHTHSALTALRNEERRLEKLGLAEPLRRCREMLRYWEFLAVLFSLERQAGLDERRWEGPTLRVVDGGKRKR